MLYNRLPDRQRGSTLSGLSGDLADGGLVAGVCLSLTLTSSLSLTLSLSLTSSHRELIPRQTLNATGTSRGRQIAPDAVTSESTFS